MATTSFDRVFASLEHKEPDRVPIDLGGTAVTGININALRRLKASWAFPARRSCGIRSPSWPSPTTRRSRAWTSMCGASGPNPPSNPGPARDHGLVGQHYRLTDEWGMGWQMPADGGHYYDLYHSPLAARGNRAGRRELTPGRTPSTPRVTWACARQPTSVVERRGRRFILERMSSGMWEHAMWMRGYEKFFTDMVYNQRHGPRHHEQDPRDQDGVLGQGLGDRWATIRSSYPRPTTWAASTGCWCR